VSVHYKAHPSRIWKTETETSDPGVLPPPGYQPNSDTLLAVKAARAGSDDEDERDTAGRVKNIGSIRQGGATRRRGEEDYDDDEYA
jgi:hypothetical protein